MSAFDDSSTPVDALEHAHEAPAGQGSITPTLAGLAKAGGIPDDVATALWHNLDVDPLNDLEIAAAIPKELVDGAFTELRAELGLTPSAVGRMTLLFTKIRAMCAPAGSSGDGQPRPKAAPKERAVRRGNISAVLDQGDNEQFDHLSVDKQAALADQFYATTGGPSLATRCLPPNSLERSSPSWRKTTPPTLTSLSSVLTAVVSHVTDSSRRKCT